MVGNTASWNLVGFRRVWTEKIDAIVCAAERAAGAARRREMRSLPTETCEWVEDRDYNSETGCKEIFVFTNDGPVENRFRICPYCGKTLVEVKKENRNAVRRQRYKLREMAKREGGK